MNVIVGMGCRRHCPHDELKQLVFEALAELTLAPDAVAALATLADKCHEPGLRTLAGDYGWPLIGFDREALNAHQLELSMVSNMAMHHQRVAGVAEAAALAGCHRLANRTDTTPRLLLPRHQTTRATVAIAGPLASVCATDLTVRLQQPTDWR